MEQEEHYDKSKNGINQQLGKMINSTGTTNENNIRKTESNTENKQNTNTESNLNLQRVMFYKLTINRILQKFLFSAN